MKIKRGAIAKCSLGLIGIITCDEPQFITYNDGNTGMAWIGFQLKENSVPGIKGDFGKIFHVKPGDLWSSKNPIVITESIDDLL